MNIGTVFVEIRGNTKRLKQDADEAKRDVVKNLSRGRSEINSMITNMRRALVAGLAFAVLRGVTRSTRVMIDMAIKAEETANLFEVSMGRMAGAGTEWVNQLSQDLGLYRTDILRSVGTLNVMIKSMGLTSEQAFDMSIALTELSVDMASFFNLKTEDSFNKLRSGMVGMSRPLQQLGILVNEQAIRETAWREGIIKTNRELTNREKVLARFLTIMAKTIAVQGDMARTFFSTENILRREAARRKAAMEDLGRSLTPLAIQGSKLTTEIVEGPGVKGGTNLAKQYAEENLKFIRAMIASMVVAGNRPQRRSGPFDAPPVVPSDAAFQFTETRTPEEVQAAKMRRAAQDRERIRKEFLEEQGIRKGGGLAALRQQIRLGVEGDAALFARRDAKADAKDRAERLATGIDAFNDALRLGRGRRQFTSVQDRQRLLTQQRVGREGLGSEEEDAAIPERPRLGKGRFISAAAVGRVGSLALPSMADPTLKVLEAIAENTARIPTKPTKGAIAE